MLNQEYDVTYAQSECYATYEFVQRPVLVATPSASMSTTEHGALKTGLKRVIAKNYFDLISMKLPDPEKIDSSTLIAFGKDTYTLAVFGLVPAEPQSEYPVLLGLTSSHIHADQLHSYKREHIFILPTLQQELYSIASLIKLNPLRSVVILRGPNVPTSIDLVYLMSNSLRAYSYTSPISVTDFTNTKSLSAAILPTRTSLFVVVGLESPAMLRSIVDRLNSGSSATVALLFSEAAASWSGLSKCTLATCGAALSRIRLTSNLPLWTNKTSSIFSSNYLGTMSTQSDWLQRHPLTAVGYFTSRYLDFLLSYSSSPTGLEALNTLYKLSVLTVDDVALGPFNDETCKPPPCRCNVGPRTLHHYSIAEVLYGRTNTTIMMAPDVRIPQCNVKYPPLPTKDTPLNIGWIVGGVVTAVVIILTTVALHNYLRRRRLNRHAPRKPPICFLLTDIQSSTRLWEKYPDQMRTAVETHHRIIRRLIKDHGAYEVKTIGDAFMIACSSILDGTLLAMDIQQCLFDAEWPEGLEVNEVCGGDTNPDVWNGLRVRIGVHYTTQVTAKYEAAHQRYDYYGYGIMMLNKVESSASGGQILMTAQSFDALSNDENYVKLVKHYISKKIAMRDAVLEGLSEPVTMLGVLPVPLSGRVFDDEETEEAALARKNCLLIQASQANTTTMCCR